MQKETIYKAKICGFLLAGIIMFNSGCKKYLEPDNKLLVTTDVVFSSDDNANAAVTGLYATMAVSISFSGEITRLTGFSSDELSYYQSTVSYDQFQTNQVLPTNNNVQTIWDNYYNVIYQCNSIIENSEASTGMSAAYKTQIIGEAKFFRAFCHFYLMNLFGPVPLINTTDKNKTAYASRSSVEAVYSQIMTDLRDALNTLPGDYVIASGKRIRANKWAAAALLARVYLYQKDWVNAEVMATAVLANSSLYSLLSAANINNVFYKNQSESILELERPLGTYTYEGGMFLSNISANLIQYPMLAGLLNSFETGDIRKTNWITTIGSASTPNKYKIVGTVASVDYLVLRVAEQYLIRAEARAQQNNFSGAQTDVNVIRNRAQLANTTTMVDNVTAMAAIETERRTELFCEWGHRWFDLKRWTSLTVGDKTRADDVLGALKTTWKSTSVVYPIPQSARDNNPNLTQNVGYN